MNAAGRRVITCRRVVKPHFASTIVLVLTALILHEMADRVWAQESDNSPRTLGSINEYLRDHEALEPPAENALNIPELGIVVCDGTGRLESGASLRGAVVKRVTPDGPGGRAGIKGQRNVAKPVLMGVFMVSALAFPPAIFGAVAIADSNLFESHDTIIAVDSERTRDVEDLEMQLPEVVGVHLSIFL